MPEFDSTTETKIASLRTRHDAGLTEEVFQLIKVEWPSPDGSVYYSVIDTSQAPSVAPSVSPIETRIIPDNNPDWFLPMQLDATIGDEEIEVEMWDADEAISQLLVNHGEGVKCRVYFWFPSVELLLPMWDGHMRFEDEADVESIKLTIAQGFRAGESTVPGRGQYDYCSAIFGGLLSTQDEIDEHDCPFNFHIGGGIGNNNPSTGQPWTFCDRRSAASCTARSVDPNFHLSHATSVLTVPNAQSSGNTLFSTSQGNETIRKDSVTVVMGTRRKYGMVPLLFRRDETRSDANHGWFFAQYGGPEGPIRSMTQIKVTVEGQTKFDPYHLRGIRLGTKGQTPYPSGDNYRLTEHSYSGTSHFLYNFGYVNPINVDENHATGSALIEGLDNIRVYTDASTYTEIFTTNRVWQIARILCDKRWGFGLDYAELDIDSWIEAAAWVDDNVTYTDPFGTEWTHIRGQSDVELIGRKVQQQIEDMCIAGRLSRPFRFNGKIHIVPLRELTGGELAACPVFTDEGDSRNIIWDGQGDDAKSSLTVKRQSSYNLTNQVKVNFDDILNEYKQRPLRPIEDIDAQLAAGRVEGKQTRKINSKDYNLLGVVHEAHATKLAWSILDLGPCDDGGLQNNVRVKFKIWIIDGLDLHAEKVIKVESSRLTKYGFTYFRVKKIKPMADLCFEIEAQAYNETYMDDFEVAAVIQPLMACSVTADCPAGYECINGVCVLILPPPVCDPVFGTITYDDTFLRAPIDECPI